MTDKSGSAYPPLDGWQCDDTGLTKREWFAGQAMIGILANYAGQSLSIKDMVASSAAYADALIAELAKDKDNG